MLSKKKLEELVRQVTGSGGGEGNDHLDPDVEEVSPLVTLCIYFITSSILPFTCSKTFH